MPGLLADASRCPASGGNSPARASGAAMPSPRFTPCAICSSDPAIRRLFKIPREMPSDCTSGTLAATSVAMARANRAVSALRSASPSSGSATAACPTTSRPAAVRM